VVKIISQFPLAIRSKTPISCKCLKATGKHYSLFYSNLRGTFNYFQKKISYKRRAKAKINPIFSISCSSRKVSLKSGIKVSSEKDVQTTVLMLFLRKRIIGKSKKDDERLLQSWLQFNSII
jgi:hypothetical protein